MCPRVASRLIGLLIAPVLLALLLAGCGGGGSEAEATPTASTVATPAAIATPRQATPTSAPGEPTRAPATARPAAPTATSAPAAGGEGKIYVVEEGDTLAIIADKVYGDFSLWQKIYEANKDEIGENPDSISIGMKLVIPPKG